jgi:hypothetical protein
MARRKNLGIASCETYPHSVRPICKIVENRQNAKIARSPTDRVSMDLYSASAIMQVYDALSPANREKFAALPLRKMADVAFKLINKARA